MARTLANHKKQAKRWLKALRGGDEHARTRLTRANPGAPAIPGLRDVQRAIALEQGFPGWTAFKRHLASGEDAPLNLIRPDEYASDRPSEPWLSRGLDVWNAILAARVGDVRELRRLLERDPNLARYSGPLHFAVREGHVKAVRLLLDAGADPRSLARRVKASSPLPAIADITRWWRCSKSPAAAPAARQHRMRR